MNLPSDYELKLLDEIKLLRERLAAAEELIHDAVVCVRSYAAANPKWTPGPWSSIRNEQDPSGAHGWLDRYDAVWKPQPQAETAEVEK